MFTFSCNSIYLQLLELRLHHKKNRFIQPSWKMKMFEASKSIWLAYRTSLFTLLYPYKNSLYMRKFFQTRDMNHYPKRKNIKIISFGRGSLFILLYFYRYIHIYFPFCINITWLTHAIFHLLLLLYGTLWIKCCLFQQIFPMRPFATSSFRGAGVEMIKKS